MKVEVLRGADELAGLAAEVASAGLGPGDSLATDLRYLAAGFEGGHPAAVVARRGGAPTAYLPFAIRRSWHPLRVGPVLIGSLPYRQLRVLGYRGPIGDPVGTLPLLCDALARATRGRYHRALLSEVVEGDPLAEALAARLGRDGVRTATQVFDSYRVALQGSHADYLARRLSAKTRGTLRRKARAFARECGADDRFEVLTGPDQVGPFLERAEAIARRTYQWRRGYHVARSTAEARRRLAHLAGRGLWRGYLLYAGSTPVAYCQGTLYGGKYDYEVPGFDERYARLSPGLVLLDRILADLFEARGADHLDFGAGAGEYKRMFATSNPRVLYLTLSPGRAYPRLIAGLEGACRVASGAGREAARRLGLRPSPPARAAEPT